MEIREEVKVVVVGMIENVINGIKVVRVVKQRCNLSQRRQREKKLIIWRKFGQTEMDFLRNFCQQKT